MAIVHPGLLARASPLAIPGQRNSAHQFSAQTDPQHAQASTWLGPALCVQGATSKQAGPMGWCCTQCCTHTPKAVPPLQQARHEYPLHNAFVQLHTDPCRVKMEAGPQQKTAHCHTADGPPAAPPFCCLPVLQQPEHHPVVTTCDTTWLQCSTPSGTRSSLSHTLSETPLFPCCQQLSPVLKGTPPPPPGPRPAQRCKHTHGKARDGLYLTDLLLQLWCRLYGRLGLHRLAGRLLQLGSRNNIVAAVAAAAAAVC